MTEPSTRKGLGSYFIRRWYDVNLMLTVPMVICAVFGHLDRIQLILLLATIVLPLHQFEEMRWPGGFPWIFNEVFNRRGGPAEAYPLNQLNCAFINYIAMLYCLLAVLFPEQLWLGISVIIFGGFGQLMMHGLLFNRKLKTFYNPGLATVVFLWVPLEIWYFVELHSRGISVGWNLLYGVLTLGAFAAIMMGLIGFKLLVNKNSRYPHERVEMMRWSRIERLTRLGVTPMPLSTETESGLSRSV